MIGSTATAKGEFGVSNFSNIWLCDPNGKLQIFYFVFAEKLGKSVRSQMNKAEHDALVPEAI